MKSTAEFFGLIEDASALSSDELLQRIAAQHDRVAELVDTQQRASEAAEDAEEELKALNKALSKQIKARRTPSVQNGKG